MKRLAGFSASAMMLVAACGAAAGELYPSIYEYDGKYVNEAVNEYLLFDNPELRKAVAEAAPNEALAELVLNVEVVSTPIDGDEELKAGLYYACEPHNCGSHNWSFVFEELTNRGAICHLDMDSGKGAEWYVKGELMLTEDHCPSELEAVPEAVRKAVYYQFPGDIDE